MKRRCTWAPPSGLSGMRNACLPRSNGFWMDTAQMSVAAKKGTKMAAKWSPARGAVRSEPFPLLRSVVRNGPERSRARRCWARRSEPLTARNVLRGSLKRERRGARLAKRGPPFWYPRPPPLTLRKPIESNRVPFTSFSFPHNFLPRVAYLLALPAARSTATPLTSRPASPDLIPLHRAAHRAFNLDPAYLGFTTLQFDSVPGQVCPWDRCPPFGQVEFLPANRLYRYRIPRVSYTDWLFGGFAIARASAVTVAEMPSMRLDDFPRSGFVGCTLSLWSPCNERQDAFQFSTG